MAHAADTGEIFVQSCAQCHGGSAIDAPRLGDTADWGRRVRAGMKRLYRSALEGLPNTAMAPRGGHRDLSDADITAVVDFMVKAAGLPADVLAAAARYDKLGIKDPDFIRLDANYDGFLSRGETAGDEAVVANLARFDANRDGRLSEAEYVALEAALGRERAAVRVGDDDLAASVRAALQARGFVSGIKIEVKDGLVSLIGIVQDADAARRAETAVKRIKGIRKIDNRLVSGHLFSFD
jgi:hypothetical protein